MEKYDALKLEKQLCFPLYTVTGSDLHTVHYNDGHVGA